MKLNVDNLVKEFPDLFDFLQPKKSIQFKLRPGQRTYLYWQHGRTQYSYTPHADVDGYYWYFDYVRVYHNARAKLGERVSTYERKRMVKCRRRKTARNGALRRYQAALKRSAMTDASQGEQTR